MIQVDYLLEFEAVVRFQNFTKAARQLSISQPVLSRHIAILEKQVGAPLLERTTRSMRLTEMGEMAFEYAQGIRQTMNDFEKSARDRLESECAVVTSGLLLFPPLSALLSRCLDRAEEEGRKVPTIKEHALGRGDDPVALLRDGEVDIAGVVLSREVMSRGLRDLDVFPVLDDDLVAFVHPSHPLAGRASAELRELERERFVRTNDGSFADSSLWGCVRSLCLESGFSPRVAFVARGSLSECTPRDVRGKVLVTTASSLASSLLGRPESGLVGVPILRQRVPIAVMTRRGDARCARLADDLLRERFSGGPGATARHEPLPQAEVGTGRLIQIEDMTQD